MHDCNVELHLSPLSNNFISNRAKQKMRRKDNRIQSAMEAEHQLPSSNRTNKKDFFKELSS